MNTIVFNELSGQVLFEEKANEVEMSSRNYLDVIDGQHPDLLSGKQTIRDSQAMRHRRSGYVQPSINYCAEVTRLLVWFRRFAWRCFCGKVSDLRTSLMKDE